MFPLLESCSPARILWLPWYITDTRWQRTICAEYICQVRPSNCFSVYLENWTLYSDQMFRFVSDSSDNLWKPGGRRDQSGSKATWRVLYWPLAFIARLSAVKLCIWNCICIFCIFILYSLWISEGCCNVRRHWCRDETVQNSVYKHCRL